MDWKTYKARNDQKQKKSKVIILNFYFAIHFLFDSINFHIGILEKKKFTYKVLLICAILADGKQVR